METNSIKFRKEIRLKRHSGIYKMCRLDKKTGKSIESENLKKFRVILSYKGKRKSRMFYTLKEAIEWKNSHSSNDIPDKKAKDPLISEIWERYKEAVFPSIERSSVETKLYRSGLIEDLFDYQTSEITPRLIDDIIRKAKATSTKNGHKKRYNFDKEIDELKVLFNWYRENDDYKFASPVLKRHYDIGKIRDIPERNKKMKPEEFLLFLASLKQTCDVLFYDLAVTQFYTASRIGEMAGLQKECVDFTNKQLEIKFNAVWDRHRKFGYLKNRPKNGKIRYCEINQTMKESLLRQFNTSKCGYVFQKDGQPLMYRDIQYNYNKALKECGLFPKYASTHIMRHSMASITRSVTGSLDAVQAVTGHINIRQVEHYAGSPSNKQKQAVLDVEKYLENNVVEFNKNKVPVPQTSTEEVTKISSSM